MAIIRISTPVIRQWHAAAALIAAVAFVSTSSIAHVSSFAFAEEPHRVLDIPPQQKEGRPPSSAQTVKPGSPTPASTNCRFSAPADTPRDHIFRGLDTIGLYMSVPVGHPGNWPPSLDADHLTKSFTEKLTKEFLPHVRLREDCRRPPVVVLDNSNLDQFRRDQAALTLIVTLTLVDSTDPQLVLLTTQFYRPNAIASGIAEQARLTKVTAIPLNLSADTIAKLLSEFVNRLQVTTDNGIAN